MKCKMYLRMFTRAQVREQRSANAAELRAAMADWSRRLHASGISERAQVRCMLGRPSGCCRLHCVMSCNESQTLLRVPICIALYAANPERAERVTAGCAAAGPAVRGGEGRAAGRAPPRQRHPRRLVHVRTTLQQD
jgi:hypothetical protein